MVASIILPYILLILLVIGAIMFQFVQEYDTFKGLILVFLLIISVFIRSALIRQIPTLIYVPKTFSITATIIAIMTTISLAILYSLRKEEEKEGVVYLFICYQISGFIQQLLFQYLFVETVYYLTHNFLSTLLLGVGYYFLYHLRGSFDKKEARWFLPGVVIVSFIWTSVYLKFGNIIPLAISHGLIGVAYYDWIYNGNILKGRSKFFAKRLK